MPPSASDQTFLLLLIILCLGACFVWAFWEVEQARARAERHRRLVRQARSLVRPGG